MWKTQNFIKSTRFLYKTNATTLKISLKTVQTTKKHKKNVKTTQKHPQKTTLHLKNDPLLQAKDLPGAAKLLPAAQLSSCGFGSKGNPWGKHLAVGQKDRVPQKPRFGKRKNRPSYLWSPRVGIFLTHSHLFPNYQLLFFGLPGI